MDYIYTILFHLIFLSCMVHCKKILFPIGTCNRDRCGTARDILEKIVYPKYTELGLQVPFKCVWNPEIDLYGDNVQHTKQVGNHWECLYCGKMFVTLHHLRLHFDRKHSSTIRQLPDSVCLERLCDVLRCSVLKHNAVQQYWDQALCDESVLKPHKNTCLKLVDSCIPSADRPKDERKLRDYLVSRLCEKLTCDTHWHVPEEMQPSSPIFYVLGAVFSVVALLSYYLLVFVHLAGRDERIAAHQKRVANYDDGRVTHNISHSSSSSSPHVLTSIRPQTGMAASSSIARPRRM